MKDQEIINALSSLDEMRLLRILDEVLRQRRIEKNYDNGDFQIDDAFVVGVGSFGSMDKQTDPQATLDIYARVGADEIVTEAGLCNYADCERCKTSLISDGKTATCPICLTENGFT